MSREFYAVPVATRVLRNQDFFRIFPSWVTLDTGAHQFHFRPTAAAAIRFWGGDDGPA